MPNPALARLLDSGILILFSSSALTMFHPHVLQDSKIMDAESIISYRFTDRLQLRNALQLADNAHPDGNRGLAQLGDVVLRLVLTLEGQSQQATRGRIPSHSINEMH